MEARRPTANVAERNRTWLTVAILTISFLAHSAFPPAVGADTGDDSAYEYGIEYQGLGYNPSDNLKPPHGDMNWYLGPLYAADDIALGFKNELQANSLYTNGIYDGEQYAGEEDFKYSGLGGIDYARMDAKDVDLWVGHGPYDGYNDVYGTPTGWLAFFNERDDHWLYPTNARWGDQDMDWLMLSTCTFLRNWGYVSQQNRLYDMLDGLHLVLGYATTMTEYSASGTRLARYITGTQTGTPHTFRYSWFQTAEDFQAAGKIVRIMGHDENYSDYLPGKGPIGNEPYPWPNDGYATWDYTTQ